MEEEDKKKKKMREHSRRRKKRTEARAREQKRNHMSTGSWSQRGKHTQSGATSGMVDSPNLLPLKNLFINFYFIFFIDNIFLVWGCPSPKSCWAYPRDGLASQALPGWWVEL